MLWLWTIKSEVNFSCVYLCICVLGPNSVMVTLLLLHFINPFFIIKWNIIQVTIIPYEKIWISICTIASSRNKNNGKYASPKRDCPKDKWASFLFWRSIIVFLYLVWYMYSNSRIFHNYSFHCFSYITKFCLLGLSSR